MSFCFAFRSLLLVLSAVILLGGCAREEAAPPAVDIQVLRVANENAFRVAWRTTAPAKALVFERGANPFRSRNWITKNPTLKIQERDGRDVLISTVPTRRFEVMIPESSLDIRGDYSLMTNFSDGGIALYTGYLNATPIHCFQLCTSKDFQDGTRLAPVIRLILQPELGEHVSVGGETSNALITHSPPSEGTIVYFGKQIPVKGRGFTAIMDPALPPWVLTEVERFMPQVLDLDTRHLGFKTSADPLVLVPYQENVDRYTLTHSGAVVGNNVLLALFGGTWARRTDEAREDLLKLVAHEAFHLWNASLFHNVDRPGARWLHEGSADAFSYLALFELGVINGKRFEDLQTEALNRCLIGLTDATLPSSDGPMSFRNYYDCGAVVQTLAGLSLRRQRSDLWKLWSSLLNQASSNRGFYTPEDYFSMLAGQGVDEATRAAIQKLTSGDVGGAAGGAGQPLETFFMTAYQGSGATLITADRDWPNWYQRIVGEKALAATLEADCSGGGYFIATESKARIVGSPRCRLLKEDREVTRLAGHDLWSEGVQVYDSVRKTCVSRNSVPLSGDNSANNVRLPCPSLPKRPLYLQFMSSNF